MDQEHDIIRTSNISDTPYLASKRLKRYQRHGYTLDQIEEKEKSRCIRLILIGNFLEYYDLTLFIHLTFILNPIFLPKGDPFVETAGKVFMFCSAYLMRPFGALFWGWIGDRYGRVFVLNSTMTLMGIASMAITTIPSYQDAGHWSVILVILCRFTQGFAAGGELQAATIYLAESSKLPEAYLRDGMVGLSCSSGRLFAGLVATICLYFHPEKGWMVPFWLGGVLAVLGTLARQALIETPDFIEALHKQKLDDNKITHQDGWSEEKWAWSLRVTLFPLYAMTACLTIFIFGYCPEQLAKLGVQPSMITAQSTALAGALAFSDLSWGYLAYKTQKPFILFKAKAVSLATIILLILIFPLPQSVWIIALVQLIGMLDSEAVPLTPLFIKAFPVFWRCRNIMLTWAITKATMYLLTSTLAFWLGEIYGIKAVICIIFIFSLFYVWAAFRSEKLLKDYTLRWA